MLIDFEIKPEDRERIKLLVDSGKYSDVEEFIQTAISNLIKREESRTKESDELDVVDNKMYLFNEIPKKLDHKIDKQDFTSLPSTFTYLLDWIKSFEVEELSDFQNRPLVSTFVSRFFPIKLIMVVIANHLYTNNKKRFRLEDVEQDVYEVAEKVAQKLKDYEENSGLTRKGKLSTGLPLPETATKGKRGRAISRMQIKISSSRERFLNQYLGHSGKKYMEKKDGKDFVEFDFQPGQCMRMGLLGYVRDDQSGEFHLSLSDIGKEFVSIKNPIIHEEKMTSLSEEESEFIFKRIIPRFTLEKFIVDRILQELDKKNSLETNELDEILEKAKTDFLEKYPSEKNYLRIKLLADVKKLKNCPRCRSKLKFDPKEQVQLCQKNRKHKIRNPNIPERVGIMGRLTEMGMVEWIIGERGKSTYKIKKVNFQKYL